MCLRPQNTYECISPVPWLVPEIPGLEFNSHWISVKMQVPLTVSFLSCCHPCNSVTVIAEVSKNGFDREEKTCRPQATGKSEGGAQISPIWRERV